ncbi:choline dehydrogenase [Mesorhizobium sp. 131-3-5]|uniref:GMC family oxidoreductase n=1 Tax=Mesorhizobium sp. 131-3-5 TaxID=2744520 RepID=UPI00192771DD|nr:choline dehydrogenase [Mesorhizobium sp. 131-3-5]BCH08401.1 choline dehydrogenase [Mesorhizobium sp. 131-3-5]
MSNKSNEYDYVIVGAGSAGCVLANRLTEDPNVSVCLLEAGPSDRSLFIQMPAALTFPIESDVYNWKFESEPESALHGRRIGQARGRCLGGSSSINGMVFVRGNPKDYDQWAGVGVEGWSFADCLPYFIKMESFEDGRDPNRGGSGPLSVTRSEAKHPFYDAFLRAGEQYGLGNAGDYNSGSQEGVHVTQATIRKGVRCSTAAAYLRPAISRPNLTVKTGCLVERIAFDGTTAKGVAYGRDGQAEKAIAGREVILSAGTIGSPHLLMLSGVGEAGHLRSHGIPLVAHSPGVGQNLQDHVVASLRFRSNGADAINRKLEGLGRVKLGLEWLLFRSGLGATSFFEVGAFFDGGSGTDYFNLQHEFLPFLADFQSGKVVLGDGFQYFVSQMRPFSRGAIRLKSADPKQYPAIRFNYFDDRRDMTEMVDGVRKTLEMAGQAAWSRHSAAQLDDVSRNSTDADIEVFIRNVANTEHHPIGTCRMGTDGDAVTDAVGLVHGIDRLRVVDGSILPKIPSANVNAPIIMAAEKIAAAIVRSH